MWTDRLSIGILIGRLLVINEQNPGCHNWGDLDKGISCFMLSVGNLGNCAWGDTESQYRFA